MPPIFGHRAKPLDPFELERTTVRELTRVLADRLAPLDRMGAEGGCATCHHAEAKAFLAKMRRLLEEMGA